MAYKIIKIFDTVVSECFRKDMHAESGNVLICLLGAAGVFFFGVYSWLVKVLGQFSIIYFRGLGLRIGLGFGLGLGLGFGFGLGLELGLGLGLVWCYGQGKFRVRVRIRVRVGFGLGL